MRFLTLFVSSFSSGSMIKGFLESVKDRQLRGWAFDTDDPSRHLEIVAVASEREVARGVANLLRVDLQTSRIGDGDHGFVLNLEQALTQELQSDLVAFTVSSGGERQKLCKIDHVTSSPTPATSIELDATAVDPKQKPLFILGAARSGTSAVAQALLATGAFEGEEEGHFFGLVDRLSETVSKYYRDNRDETLAERRTLLGRIHEDLISSYMGAVTIQLCRNAYPSGRWLDKTPTREMVSAVPRLKAIFPEAKFLFLKRRALENICSRMRKFPGVSFDNHCRDWASVMMAWLDVRTRVDAECWLEVDQMELGADPTGLSSTIADFVGLDPSQGQLFAQAIRTDHPERTSSAFAVPLEISTMPWDAEQKQAFFSYCNDAMKLYGYAVTKEYRS